MSELEKDLSLEETIDAEETTDAEEITDSEETASLSADTEVEPFEDASEQREAKKEGAELSGDLRRLAREFPEIFSVDGAPTDITAIEGFERYSALRGAGLEPIEAYYAVNGQSVTERRVRMQKSKEKRQSTSHLRPAAAVGERPSRVMTARERSYARASLGISISDAELERLWKKINDN